MNSQVKRFNLAVDIFCFVLGICLTIIGALIGDNIFQIVLVSVGSTLIASSIVVFFSLNYFSRQEETNDVTDRWGLRRLYETRTEMDDRCNEMLKKIKDELDITSFTLKRLIIRQGNLFKDKVNNGLKVRILTMNPNSEFVKQREKEEKVGNDSIKVGILSLVAWVEKVNQEISDDKKIQIKFYDSFPLEFCLRQDDCLFTGPFLYGMGGQVTITYEYSKNSQGYEYWKKYFNELWNDNQFCSSIYKGITDSKQI